MDSIKWAVQQVVQGRVLITPFFIRLEIGGRFKPVYSWMWTFSAFHGNFDFPLRRFLEWCVTRYLMHLYFMSREAMSLNYSILPFQHFPTFLERLRRPTCRRCSLLAAEDMAWTMLPAVYYNYDLPSTMVALILNWNVQRTYQSFMFGFPVAILSNRRGESAGSSCLR